MIKLANYTDMCILKIFILSALIEGVFGGLTFADVKTTDCSVVVADLNGKALPVTNGVTISGVDTTGFVLDCINAVTADPDECADPATPCIKCVLSEEVDLSAVSNTCNDDHISNFKLWVRDRADGGNQPEASTATLEADRLKRRDYTIYPMYMIGGTGIFCMETTLDDITQPGGDNIDEAFKAYLGEAVAGPRKWVIVVSTVVPICSLILLALILYLIMRKKKEININIGTNALRPQDSQYPQNSQTVSYNQNTQTTQMTPMSANTDSQAPRTIPTSNP